MTPRNLFNIILKVFGLFFLREMVITLPQLATHLLLLPDYVSGQGILTLTLTFIILAYYAMLVYFLVFRTDYVLDKLKLDQGFSQEEFAFNFSTNKVLTIALLVIAGIILLYEVPNLCRELTIYFQDRGILDVYNEPDFSYMIVSGVKIVIALLLIGERNRIIALIEKKPTTDFEPDQQNKKN